MATTDYCECDNTHKNNNTECQYCFENEIKDGGKYWFLQEKYQAGKDKLGPEFRSNFSPRNTKF